AKGAARRAMGGARGPSPRRPDRRELAAAQPRHQGGTLVARARHRGRLGGPAGGHVAAPRPLLHPLGGPARDAVRHRGRPPAGPPGVLLGFLEGRRARELGRPPAAERRSAVVDCFARLFGPRAATPGAYLERLWADEEWSRGCYGCHMPTGAWTAYGPALR